MSETSSREYSVQTKNGFRVCTDTRKHDGQRLVLVTHEEDLIKLEPVDTEEELSQWFWFYVEEFGGEQDA